MQVVRKLARLAELQEEFGPRSKEVDEYIQSEKDDIEFQRYAQMSFLVRLYTSKSNAITFGQALALTLLNLVSLALFLLTFRYMWTQ